MTKDKNSGKKSAPIRPWTPETCDHICEICDVRDACPENDDEDYFDDEDYIYSDRQVVPQIHDIAACLLDIHKILASNEVGGGTADPLRIVATRLAQAAEVLSSHLITQQKQEESND